MRSPRALRDPTGARQDAASRDLGSLGSTRRVSADPTGSPRGPEPPLTFVPAEGSVPREREQGAEAAEQQRERRAAAEPHRLLPAGGGRMARTRRGLGGPGGPGVRGAGRGARPPACRDRAAPGRAGGAGHGGAGPGGARAGSAPVWGNAAWQLRWSACVHVCARIRIYIVVRVCTCVYLCTHVHVVCIYNGSYLYTQFMHIAAHVYLCVHT